MSHIAETVRQRDALYGGFAPLSELSQDIKALLRDTDGWARMDSSQREAVELIVHKLARIINGDPNYADSWVDLAGYAQLIADRLHT